MFTKTLPAFIFTLSIITAPFVFADPPRVTDATKIASFAIPPNNWYQYFIFDPKGEIIFAKTSEGHVHRLNIQSGEIMDFGKLMDPAQWYEQQLDIHPCRDMLLIAGGVDGRSNAIDLLDSKDGSVLKTFSFPGRNMRFRYVYFINGGRQWLTFSYSEDQRKRVRRSFIIVDVETGKMTEKTVPFASRPEPGFALDIRREKIALIHATDHANYFVIYDLNNNFRPLHKFSFSPYTVSNIIFMNNNQSVIYFNDFGIINSKIELAVGMRHLGQEEDDFTLVSPTPIRECAVSGDDKNMFLSLEPKKQLFVNFKAAKAIGAQELRNPLFSNDSKLFAAIDLADGNEGIIEVYCVDSLSSLCAEKGITLDFLLPSSGPKSGTKLKSIQVK